MDGPAVSVVIPAYNEMTVITETVESLVSYFQAERISYELLVVSDGSTDGTDAVVAALASSNSAIHLLRLEQNSGKGAAVKHGVGAARGAVIAFTDADLPYKVENLGHAIELVRSGETDIAIGARDLPESQSDPSYPALRKFMGKSFSFLIRVLLVRNLFDTQCGLKAFSSDTAKLLFERASLSGFSFDFEVLFLAWRYGFRVAKIPVGMSHRHESKVRLVSDSAGMLRDVFRVRRNARTGLYGQVGECPVCGSTQLSSLAQVRAYLVRKCGRCRCRFLSRFPSAKELEALYNESYYDSTSDLVRGYSQREEAATTARMAEVRSAQLRQLLTPGSSVLEIGAGTGELGQRLAKEFRYSAIELSSEAAERARQAGLEVACTSLENYSSEGKQFDAVVMIHLFEHLADPHAAVQKLRTLLAPGGILFLVTPATDSLLARVSGSRWVSYKFPEHLILYSRRALRELLVRHRFEVVSMKSDFEYREREFIVSRLRQLSGIVGTIGNAILRPLPKVMPVTSGSVRMVARLQSEG